MKTILVLAAFVLLYVVGSVLADGYGGGGGGGYPIMITSGGGGGGGKRGGKWQIRARGKGMQNMYPMYQHHYGGGEYKKKKEEHHQEVVYYPVPIYTPQYEHHEEYKYKPKEEHKVDIIPIHLGGGYGGGGYGGGGGGGYGSLMSLMGGMKGY